MEDGRYRSIENLLLSISLSKRSTINQVGFEFEGWLEKIASISVLNVMPVTSSYRKETSKSFRQASTCCIS
jgi:hypothetical protein